MALNYRNVSIAAIVAFIAWGFVTHWVPVLRYLGYTYLAGALSAGLCLVAVEILSVRKLQDVTINRVERSQAAAFTAPEVWEAETNRIGAKGIYQHQPLYPSSFVVSDSIDSLLDLVLRDFITSWYSNITRSPYFVNEIDSAVRTALVNIRERVENVDIIEIAVSRFVPIITEHMKGFYDAERAVRGKNLSRNVTDAEELELAIAAKYRDGKLHKAASLAFSDTRNSQRDYLRRLIVRLLPSILPESMIKSQAVSALIKEIISCAVLAPVMEMLADPDTCNQLMEAYGRTVLQDRKSVRKLRAALDEHASPAPKAPKLHSFPRLSPNDDERKFERFIRAARQVNNLSDARRFRSEVASQLKRGSMMEGPDHMYLRRLQTGKRVLDQRVGRLSAVGGSMKGQAPAAADSGKIHATPRLANASLLDVLHDASGLSYFMEYMDRQMRMPLVQFWIVVDGFRNPLEDDYLEEDNFSGIPPKWSDSDRRDLAQIAEAYLTKPELKVQEPTQEAVQQFLRAGTSATPEQYLNARAAVLRAQSAVLEEMREVHFPSFKRSDLYYKYLTSDDASAKPPIRATAKPIKSPSVPSIAESPTRPPRLVRSASRPGGGPAKLRRNGLSYNDLKSSATAADESNQPQQRRSFDDSPSTPLFDDDVESEAMARSVHSLDGESADGDQTNGNQAEMVEAMEAALSNIMIDGLDGNDSKGSLFDLPEPDALFEKDTNPAHDFIDAKKADSILSEGKRERPNLASLGLVNTSSRIGVFTDNDLFGDEEKFIEDEYADPEEFNDEKGPEDEIHQAAPGDLGLAEAISALTTDIEKLVAQDAILDTLTRKAELTNNVAELRILGKSKASLQREIRRKELQRQQYIVQESDNSLYGRANVEIKSIMVGKEEDGQEFALYVIEVRRTAGEHIPAASWAVARRYSEFHDLNQRLRSLYPAVRQLDFPRRRLVMKLQREFLHKRRKSLQNYLCELLRLPAVCRGRDLRAFLSQQAILSTTHSSQRDSERRDIVSRIYNSVTDGMEEFLGNIPVLDQLSVAGQNLISAATNQFNAVPSTTATNEKDDTFLESAEAKAELDAFENRELEPFVKPICDIFLEVFELNRGNNWLRGRAVVVVLQQLLGGTVERRVRESARVFMQEDSILKWIALVKDTIWPNGQLNRDRVVRTTAEKIHSRREASVTLATLVPDLASNVVGRANAQAASRRIFATFNNPRLNTHLAFVLLDEVLAVLFPDAMERAR
ncbi:Intermediate filament protein [Bachmanniomyces sp. S44760]|nr:Intermediate filament protein [Bachmanniomyces sp. S44760]